MSVAAIQARIAQIQSQFPTPPAKSVAAGRFSAALSAATAAPEAQQPAASSTATAVREPWSPGPFVNPAAASAVSAPAIDMSADLSTRYDNGKIPASAMTEIGGGHRLWQPAADGFKRMMAAAEAAGITIGVTDSYRSYDQQVDVAERKGLYSQGGLAAQPGTSDHGWGKSLDLDLDAEAQQWMRANAKQYGFVEDVPREPWHWTFGASKG